MAAAALAIQELKILNCGLTGGQRDMMLKLLSRMVQVLQDPALAIRQKNEDINLSHGLRTGVVFLFGTVISPAAHCSFLDLPLRLLSLGLS